jgi:hypothetical protein
VLSAFSQLDVIACDIAELLKDAFLHDPATTFALYSTLEA